MRYVQCFYFIEIHTPGAWISESVRRGLSV